MDGRDGEEIATHVSANSADGDKSPLGDWVFTADPRIVGPVALIGPVDLDDPPRRILEDDD